MSILSLRGLVKRYHERQVVCGVSLDIEQGQVIGLLGPNGAGKTTTFYMTVGMIQPEQGQVFIDQTDITSFQMYLRARYGIGYLPQESSVFKKLSVYDNIFAILEMRGIDRKENIKKTTSLLEEMGIGHLFKQKAVVLSGGERRRLEICRVLAIDPKFILLDEPFAGIDPMAVADIQTMIRHLTHRGIGVLISDHNVRETLGVCDSAYILSDGKVIESGSPDSIASSEIARKIYLGETFRL
ncbi:MAG: LPS export ABC transporter ATP-binding protein [Desulfobacterales bacterium]|nr:LPS export ABC transporter ATP-binding protein [Desulfobacterales bacterium]